MRHFLLYDGERFFIQHGDPKTPLEIANGMRCVCISTIRCATEEIATKILIAQASLYFKRHKDGILCETEKQEKKFI